jgi:hypothetical protein
MRGIDTCAGAVNGRGAAAFALAAVLIAAVSSEAQACVGSGLLIPSSMGLLIFNLGIALVEALLARFLFKARFGRAYGIMVLANYFSLAAGLPFVRPITDALELLVFSPPRLLYIRDLARLAVWVTFALTIVLEVPFGLWLMWDKKRRVIKAAAFTLVSRALIYFLVPIQATTVWFALRGVETALPDTHATRNPGAVVCYADNNSGDLWSIRLDGTEKKFVAATSCREEFAFLVPTIDEATGRVKLEMWVKKWGERASSKGTVFEGEPFAPKEDLAAVGLKWMQAIEGMTECGVDLSSPDSYGTQGHGTVVGGWSFRVGPVESRPHKYAWDDTVYLHYQTPFDVKDWHAVSRLPNDEAVAQVDGQIVLVDMRKDTIAFLVEGHSPFVLPEVTNRTVVAAQGRYEGPAR